MKPHGRDYVKVICSVCRGEFYQKDTIIVSDPNNYQYGQLVCKDDIDKINEQVLPVTIREQPISAPETLRPDLTAQFTANTNDDRLPGSPRMGHAMVNTINDTIDLYWQAPEDPGSSNIEGYLIQRANPQLSTYETIIANTGTNSTYYQDLTADPFVEYSYRIAAINGFGQGPYSIDFFWPAILVTWFDIEYLTAYGEAIEVGPSVYLRTNH